ncbi:MAG: hypothetical protein AB1609_20775, partial [Bacillota bacterium]
MRQPTLRPPVDAGGFRVLDGLLSRPVLATLVARPENRVDRKTLEKAAGGYNGELYNTEEVRSELKGLGHVFESYSDTEVLLRSYMEWGPQCTARFNGIFAFAVWDDARARLFMARDRLGVKPLFYAERDGGLLFGSELKALLAHPAVPPEIDAEGLAEVLVVGPGRTPGHGVFRGVHELKPGWWLLFERDVASSAGPGPRPVRGRLRTLPYWSLQ